MAITTKAAFEDVANTERNIQELSEMIRSSLLTQDVNDIFTIVPNIKGKKQLVASGNLEYITKADASCGTGFEDPDVPAISQTWDPKTQSVKLKICKEKFEGQFTQWLLKNGVEMNDISDTDMAAFIVEEVGKAIKADRMRIALHGYSTIGNDSVLRSSTLEGDYENIDMGVLKTLQYFDTINDINHNGLVLSKNAQDTIANQYDLPDKYAYNLYRELTDTVDFEGDILLTSHSLWSNYEKQFLDAGNFPIENTVDRMQKGIPSLSVNGARLVDMRMYDKYRRRDFITEETIGGDQEDTIHDPHFALFTKKSNLLLGVDSEEALTDLSLEYVGGDTEAYFIKAKYKMDFKVGNPYEIKWAVKSA